MIGLNKHSLEFALGDRIVSIKRQKSSLVSSTETQQKARIERIITLDQDPWSNGETRMTTDAGRSIRITGSKIAKDKLEDWTTIWTDPLPADDSTAITYATRLASVDKESHIMFRVAAVNERLLFAHHLSDELAHPESIATKGLSYATSCIAISANKSCEPEKTYLAQYDRCNLEDGIYVHYVKECCEIAQGTLIEIAALIPAIPSHKDLFKVTNLMKGAALEEAETIAWAKSEPSEALVVCWLEDGDEKISVLGTSGIAFLNQDEPEAYLEQTLPGPGLWMFINAELTCSCSYEGEWDVDIDGDWRPATLEDIQAHIGTESIARKEIAMVMDLSLDDAPQNLLQDLIAQAVGEP